MLFQAISNWIVRFSFENSATQKCTSDKSIRLCYTSSISFVLFLLSFAHWIEPVFCALMSNVHLLSCTFFLSFSIANKVPAPISMQIKFNENPGSHCSRFCVLVKIWKCTDFYKSGKCKLQNEFHTSVQIKWSWTRFSSCSNAIECNFYTTLHSYARFDCSRCTVWHWWMHIAHWTERLCFHIHSSSTVTIINWCRFQLIFGMLNGKAIPTNDRNLFLNTNKF